MSQKRGIDNRRRRRISAVQSTQYWMLETSLWIYQDGSYPDFANESIGTSHVDSARIVILPKETATFRIVFHLATHPSLPTRITYQQITRNGSEVFRIVGSGQVSALKQAIERGTASLGDRDEQGRPLLYVS